MKEKLTQADLRKLCGNMPPPGSTKHTDRDVTERTKQQQENHEAITSVLGRYRDKVPSHGRSLAKGELLDWEKLVTDNKPKSFFGQRTGSCVGANSANTLLIQIALENLVLNRSEKFDLDWWWLYTYGWGRYFGGMRSEGDGSYLSVQYKAFVEKGIPHLSRYQFPEFQEESGARWTSSRNEYKWSARKNIPKDLDDIADDHLVDDGAMISTMEELDEAILVRPLGYAGMLGSNRIYTKEGVKMSDWSGRWSHCMGIAGVWNHEKLGMLYKIMNRSWTPSQYSWFWITRDTMAKVMRDSATEIMKISDFRGIPEEGIDVQWLISLILSLMN